MPYIYSENEANAKYQESDLHRFAPLSYWIFELVADALTIITKRQGCNLSGRIDRLEEVKKQLEYLSKPKEEYFKAVAAPLAQEMINAVSDSEKSMMLQKIMDSLTTLRNYVDEPPQQGLCLLANYPLDLEALQKNGKDSTWFDTEMTNYVRSHVQQVIGELDAAIRVDKAKSAPFVDSAAAQARENGNQTHNDRNFFQNIITKLSGRPKGQSK